MSGYETFVVTFFATFLATLPAVFIGIWAERRLAARGRKRRSLEALTAVNRDGSPLYDIRDWANQVSTAVTTGQYIGISNSVGSSNSLRWLLEAGLIPDPMHVDLAVLAGHVDRLHVLIDGHIGQVLPAGPLAQFVTQEADLVSGVARTLLDRATKALVALQ